MCVLEACWISPEKFFWEILKFGFFTKKLTIFDLTLTASSKFCPGSIFDLLVVITPQSMVVCYGKVKFLYTLNVRQKFIAENNLTFHVCSYEVKILSYDIYLLHIGLLNFNFRKVFQVKFFHISKFLLNKVIAYFSFCYI